MPVLVRPPSRNRAAPDAGADPVAAAVLGHPGGPLRVLGGAGTGKTTLIAHAVAQRVVERGVDPENVLVLAANRRAAADLRERIVELITDGGARTMREPLVRTVHSYAFAVLRLQAAREEIPPPRLLSGPEQDVVVRELLAGDVADGTGRWPDALRSALGLPAFAAELRDLVLRAAERGLGPEDLLRLGREHRRDGWVAAATFFETYEQVMLLQGSVGLDAPQATSPPLDAAELVSTALLTLDTDDALLRRERDRVRHLFVDDAQHLDPQQAQLVVRLGVGAREVIVFGDPDQTVFSFRGADPGLLTSGASEALRLDVDHRMAPEVRRAVNRLAARLPGARHELAGPPDPDNGQDARATGQDARATGEHARATGEHARATGGHAQGRVDVEVFRSAAAEAAWVADRLRRAHLLDGVPWPQMAVLVRSMSRSLPVLRRALLAAGVPVAVPGTELPVARQGAVIPLLLLLRCAVEPDRLAVDDAAGTLLASPLGGADPIALRRLRRELRRLELAAGGERSSSELLVSLLTDVVRGADVDPLTALDERTARPVRTLAELLRAAAQAAADQRPAEDVLWAVWQRTGLAQRWSELARWGGPTGAQADRDLDAVVVLFDAAARYADRLPGADCGPAGVLGFSDYIESQQIVGDTLAPRSPQGDAVAVLTAHGAAGREWTVVAVPGVQEGVWPDLRLRGTLLGVEHMVDVVAGLDPDSPVSRTAPLLAEERRLLLLAASRARHHLLVSAVQGEDEQPSRFLDEIDGSDTDPDAGQRPIANPGRGLSLSELVAELRRAVTNPDTDPDVRERAAAGLARLAAARVPGAHPDTWYGLGSITTAAALRPVAEPARVSPSVVELVSTCPLRWMLTRHGGDDVRELPAVTGSLVHGLVQAAAAGATDAELEQALVEAWTSVDAGAPWFSRREQQRVREMVTAFRGWFEDSRDELTQVGLELAVSVPLPGADGEGDVLLRGRVDRLERDRQGRPVVIDVKTSKTAVTAKAAEAHPQLAVYQLAAAHGAFVEQGCSADPGGARLVQVRKPKPEVRQSPLDPDGVAHWLGEVRGAARATAGPGFLAQENADCDRCPSRTACPLHGSGRQVTE